MALPSAQWQCRLDELAREHQVPGAVLAVVSEGQVTEIAIGTVNVETGIPVTAGSVFHIASMTKMYTATMVMQLVDEGRLDLDRPLSQYLPGLRLPDRSATETVTARHLLTHTAGFDGDNIGQYGDAPDAIARSVGDIHILPQVSRPGEVFSYSNGGFTLLGLLVQELRGMDWHDVLRTCVLERLGVETPLTALEDVIYRRVAVGHGPGPDGHPVVFRGHPTRAGAPGGDWWIYATASDVLALVSAFLEDGRAADGTHVLSPEAVAQMRQAQIAVPDKTETDAWGLGLALWSSNGHQIVGHSGNLLGMTSFARWLPEEGAGMVLLTNGAFGEGLFRAVFEELFGARWGVTAPRGLAVPSVPPAGIDASRYVGVYERRFLRIEVEEDEGGLVLRAHATGQLAGAVPDMPLPLTPVTREAFVVSLPGMPVTIAIHFLGFDADGRPKYLSAQNRISRRVA